MSTVKEMLGGAYFKHPLDQATITDIISNSNHSPQLISAGWKGHAVSYLVYENKIYMVNKGEGASVSDGKVNLFTAFDVPEAKMSDALKIISNANSMAFGEATAEINKIYSELGASKPATIFDGLTATMQRTGNCGFASNQGAARLAMWLLAEKELGEDGGVPTLEEVNNRVEQLYKDTISGDAMRKDALQTYVNYKVNEDIYYNPYEDQELFGDLGLDGKPNSLQIKRYEIITELKEKNTHWVFDSSNVYDGSMQDVANGVRYEYYEDGGIKSSLAPDGDHWRYTFYEPEGSYYTGKVDAVGNKLGVWKHYNVQLVLETTVEYSEGHKLIKQVFYDTDIESDNTIQQTVTYEYDESGRLIEEIHTPSEGEVSTFGYLYDSDGRIYKKLHIEGNLWEKTVYEYDNNKLLSTSTTSNMGIYTNRGMTQISGFLWETESGLLVAEAFNEDDGLTIKNQYRYEYDGLPIFYGRTLEIETNGNGELVSTATYKYNSDGGYLKTVEFEEGGVEELYFDRTGELEKRVVIEFDANGNIVSREVFGSDDVEKPLRESDFTYRDSGQLSSETILHEDGYEEFRSWDADGNLASEGYVKPGSLGSFKTVYTYDSNGVKLSETKYVKEKIVSTINFQNDVNGNPIFAIEQSGTKKTEYTFDEQGRRKEFVVFDNDVEVAKGKYEHFTDHSVKITNNSDGTAKVIKFTDSEERPFEENIRSSSGELVSKTRLTYNTHGILATEETTYRSFSPQRTFFVTIQGLKNKNIT